MYRYVVDLDDAAAARIADVGGKAASLSRLISLGYRVPAGFVVTTSAFDAFLEESGVGPALAAVLRKLAGKTHPSTEYVVRIAEDAKALIREAAIPAAVVSQFKECAARYHAPFAVRSSATLEDGRVRSWAGLFDSHLSVKRDAVVQRVKECWLSLYNARALSYAPRAYEARKRLSMAVIVEEMIAADTAGVVFSADPTYDSNDTTALIEAVHGLGERLVSGAASDLAATVDAKSGAVTVLLSSGPKPAGILSVRQLRTLARTAREIESAYGFPVDIEWAYKKSQLFLLQARPITRAETLVTSRTALTEPPNLSDYELTFKVTGLSFLFADMLAHGFEYLEPLFTADEAGSFRQYFSNRKMAYAARYGIETFNRRGSVEAYRKKFTSFYENARAKLDALLVKPRLNRRSLAEAFTAFSSLMTYYSKSDNEFTDAAYRLRDYNPDIRKNLDLLAKFKDIARVWVNDCLLTSDSYFARTCAKLSSQFNIAPDDVSSYSVRELIALFSGKYVPPTTLADRRLAYVMYYAGAQQRHIVGSQAVAYINSTARTLVAAGTSEVRGQIAHRTRRRFIKGRVNVINVDYGDLAAVDAAIVAMSKGDILVAEFTAPELLLACRKARAIVTDIGGLLSHAAIVSRDLNVPCVVGTAHATRIFRTGDIAVIDLNSGIVRRLGAA